jgi:hypothetical protein
MAGAAGVYRVTLQVPANDAAPAPKPTSHFQIVQNLNLDIYLHKNAR